MHQMTNKYMYFIANWKMYGGLNSLNSLNKVIKFLKVFKKNNIVKIIYCPPNTLINSMTKKLKKTRILVGAQNCHENETFGPFTGYINSSMLKNAGAKFVIIGHSERRSLCHETSSIVSQKAVKAVSAGLKVIICIGENSKDREKGDYLFVLEDQLKQSLSDLSSDNNLLSNDIIIAYEPVWAIGTGNTASKKDIEEVHKFIKEIISSNYQFNYDLPILYGGSVNSKNSSEIFKINNVDGVLVGGASLNSDEFLKIINNSM